MQVAATRSLLAQFLRRWKIFKYINIHMLLFLAPSDSSNMVLAWLCQRALGITIRASHCKETKHRCLQVRKHQLTAAWVRWQRKILVLGYKGQSLIRAFPLNSYEVHKMWKACLQRLNKLPGSTSFFACRRLMQLLWQHAITWLLIT